MIFRPCYFYFFFHTRRVGWVGFGKYGKFHTFFFEGFPKYFKVQNKSNNTQSDAALITSLEWMQNALDNNKTIEKNILQELTDRYNTLIEMDPDHLKAALRAHVAFCGIGFLNHFVCINVAKAHLVV